MLGIGFGEIMLITVIGLIVIGPKRLPETARFLGHLFGRIQRQISEVKRDIKQEMALEDVKNIHNEYKKAAHDMRNVFDDAAKGMPTSTDDIAAGGDGGGGKPATSKPDSAADKPTDDGQDAAAVGGVAPTANAADASTPPAAEKTEPTRTP